MTPGYDLNSPPSPFPFIALKEDQQLQFFVPPHQASSSLSSPIFFNITHQDQSASHPREPQKNQQKAEKYIFHVGSSDHRVIPSSSVQPTVDSTKDGHGSSISKLADEAEDKRSDHESAKWMSSKMRLMPKMMNTGCAGTYKQERIIQKSHDQDQDKSGNYSSNSSNNIIRTCSDCNTTKTPLWRSGPQGPKSLCNACGIRQRKARRAMAAAANGMVLDRDNSTRRSKLQSKEKKSPTGYTTQYKKPFNLPGPPHQRGDKISFEDFALSLSKHSALRRAFPKDEEEAAILLMALSCGLLHS